MPYIEVSEEQLKAFDPDGKLKIYEPEDTDGLKKKANDLLGEKKALESELLQSKADLKLAKSAKPNENDADALALQSKLDDAMGQIDEWKGKYSGLQDDIKSKTLEGEALRIASSLTKDPNRANLLMQQIRNRLTLDGENFSVLDESGNPTISTVEELTGQVKTAYPFLVDGSQASGGGAQGGSGGAAGAYKKFSEYNAGELAEILNDKPEVYDRLKNEHYGT
jgi:hypothetical protein